VTSVKGAVLQEVRSFGLLARFVGGHPMAGPQGDNMYSAQVLWDEGMADTAIKWLERNPGDSTTVFVVIAGSGHVMYGQGINYRIRRRTKQPGVTVVMGQANGDSKVAKGIGDFVYVTPAPPDKG